MRLGGDNVLIGPPLEAGTGTMIEKVVDSGGK